MGINRDYFCCLCKDKYHPDDLHGLQWKGNQFEKTDSRTTERHLCENCLRSAHKLWTEYTAVRRYIDTDV